MDFRKCPYCSGKVSKTRGRGYGATHDCIDCGAYVGCHRAGRNKGRPLGTVANAEDRKLRGVAHRLFDSLWRRKMRRDSCGQSTARSAAYSWLAREMGIPKKECHMAMMQSDRLNLVISICQRPYGRKEGT